MLTAVRREGIKVIDNSLDADAVLLWSVLWQGRMRQNQQIYDHYRHQGRPVIIVEVGTLRRNHTWKVAIDNISRLGYYGHEQDLDPDRPRRLGIGLHLADYRRPHVLIACQNSHSLQMDCVGDQTLWIGQQIRTIRACTDRPIRVRPHPRSPLGKFVLLPGVEVEIPRKVAHTYDDFDLDLGCHAVVNINSGPGILAPLAGTPVVVDSSSLAHPISISIEQIESPPDRDIEQWLIGISHTEYVIPELSDGLWLRRLSSRL